MGINVSGGVGMHVQGNNNEILPFCDKERQTTNDCDQQPHRTNTVLEYSM